MFYDRLRDYVEELIRDLDLNLLDQYKDEERYKQVDKQLKIIEDERDKYLFVNEYKQYPLGIRVKDFLEQIQLWANEYGGRVKNNNEGIDYKSIANAFRILFTAEELANKGDLVLPLPEYEVDYLLDIKKGAFDYIGLIKDLNERVEEVADLLRSSDKLRAKPKSEEMEKLLLKCYHR